MVGGICSSSTACKTGDKLVGATTAFDRFFLWVVLAVIGTGVVTEIFRFIRPSTRWSVSPSTSFTWEWCSVSS